MERVGVTDQGAVERAYGEALSGALAVLHPTPALVRAKGASWRDLLQRMSTNDLNGMQPGDVRPTVLTTAVAQIVDLVSVAAGEGEALLAASHGRGRRVREWLQRYIFFQDDVRLEEVAEGWVCWGVYGPRAEEEAGRIVPTEIGASGRVVSWAGGSAWRVSRPAGGGIFILLAPDAAGEATQLWGGGAEEAQRAYQLLRIEAGIPEIGSEILDDSLPLEVGLKGAVSFTKGCYIGQEIIARMDSRGRLAKELLGVRAESVLAAGEDIRQGGRTVGHLTSAALSPRYGAIAMASARPSALDEGEGWVEVGERRAPGRLVPLPFDAGG